MIKSKVIDSLKTLKKNELKDFSDFIKSPYFNKNRNVYSLFLELKNFYPDFEGSKMTKEIIFAKLFPGKEYTDKTIRNLMSDLMAVIEKYFIQKDLENRKLLLKYLLITALSGRNLVKSTGENIKEAEKLFNDEKFDGGNLYFIKHLIEMEKDYLEIIQNKMINLNMKEGEFLVYSFLGKYMGFKMKSINYKYKLGSEKTSEFIEEFEKNVNIDSWMSYLESIGGVKSELILTYFYTTKFMTDLPDDVSFQKALKLFYRNRSHINTTETLNLYLTFTGYCAVKIAKGAKEYTHTLFELYSKMAEENMLMGAGEENIHITIFNNIVTTALSLGKADWAKKFIDQYSPKLIPEYRETMFNYAYSRYYFSINEFERSMEHLSRVTMDNFWIKSRSKILQLRLYYELGYIEAFFSLHDSIKHSLKADKLLPQYEKDNDALFISLLGRLAKIKFSGSGEKIQNIKEEAQSTLKSQLLNWMLKKIEELESSRKSI